MPTHCNLRRNGQCFYKKPDAPILRPFRSPSQLDDASNGYIAASRALNSKHSQTMCRAARPKLDQAPSAAQVPAPCPLGPARAWAPAHHRHACQGCSSCRIACLITLNISVFLSSASSFACCYRAAPSACCHACCCRAVVAARAHLHCCFRSHCRCCCRCYHQAPATLPPEGKPLPALAPPAWRLVPLAALPCEPAAPGAAARSQASAPGAAPHSLHAGSIRGPRSTHGQQEDQWQRE